MKIEELADVCQTTLCIERKPREENEEDCEWKVSLQGCGDVGEGCSLAMATENFLTAIKGNEITVTKDGEDFKYYVPKTIVDHFI